MKNKLILVIVACCVGMIVGWLMRPSGGGIPASEGSDGIPAVGMKGRNTYITGWKACAPLETPLMRISSPQSGIWIENDFTKCWLTSQGNWCNLNNTV